MDNLQKNKVKWYNLVWGMYQEDRSEYEKNEDRRYERQGDKFSSSETKSGYEEFLDGLYGDEVRVSHGRWIPTSDNQFNHIRPKETSTGYTFREHRK